MLFFWEIMERTDIFDVSSLFYYQKFYLIDSVTK